MNPFNSWNAHCRKSGTAALTPVLVQSNLVSGIATGWCCPLLYNPYITLESIVTSVLFIHQGIPSTGCCINITKQGGIPAHIMFSRCCTWGLFTVYWAKSCTKTLKNAYSNLRYMHIFQAFFHLVMTVHILAIGVEYVMPQHQRVYSRSTSIK